jgi:sugar phosphate isomerase/epimerase
VGGDVFLFNRLEAFAEYARHYPGLGILIDISHNFHDGRAVRDILKAVEGLNVTGLHLSDAISGTSLKEGTHLPVGSGKIDFDAFLQPFISSDRIYGALEVKGSYDDVKSSLKKLSRYADG